MRHPLFWLSLQIALTLGVLAATGGLEPQEVPDTKSFLDAAKLDSPVEALAHYRSIGYPTFLRLITSPGKRLTLVPAVQIGLYCLSLYLFWYSVKRLSGSGWLALAATLPLPWAGIMTIASVVMPDFLAAVAAIMAVSCLILLVTGPPRILWWVGVAGGVFAAYQLRPAAVFILALVPPLGMAMRWLRNSSDWRGILRWSAGLAAMTLVPFVLFCNLRWITVGHFGVVSFGGTNLAGLAASFIDGKVVRQLPQEHRLLAKGLKSKRAKLGLGYFAVYLLLVCVVSFPVPRYFVSMTLFLPSAIVAQLFVIWHRILTARA